MMNNDVSDGKLAMCPWLPISVRLLFAGLEYGHILLAFFLAVQDVFSFPNCCCNFEFDGKMHLSPVVGPRRRPRGRRQGARTWTSLAARRRGTPTRRGRGGGRERASTASSVPAIKSE